jgi:ubiquinone biosynthesis protein UbiJ
MMRIGTKLRIPKGEAERLSKEVLALFGSTRLELTRVRRERDELAEQVKRVRVVVGLQEEIDRRVRGCAAAAAQEENDDLRERVEKLEGRVEQLEKTRCTHEGESMSDDPKHERRVDGVRT